MISENKLHLRFSMMLRLWTRNDNGDRNHNGSNCKMGARARAETTLLTTAEEDTYISTLVGG